MVKKTKIPKKVLNYLEKSGIDHKILEHKTVYTAIDTALTMRKKLTEIVKSLLIKADKDYYLVLLPADYNLDLKKLKKVISKVHQKDIKIVKIPGEKIVENTLKIKTGALSAFGNLHKVPVIVEKNLEKLKKAVFSAGSFNHSLELAVKDFIKLEKAASGSFGKKKKIKIAKPKKKVVKKRVIKKK